MSKPHSKELVKEYLHNHLNNCGVTDPAICEALAVPVLRLLEWAWDAGKRDSSAPEHDDNPWRGWNVPLTQIVTTTEK